MWTIRYFLNSLSIRRWTRIMLRRNKYTLLIVTVPFSLAWLLFVLHQYSYQRLIHPISIITANLIALPSSTEAVPKHHEWKISSSRSNAELFIPKQYLTISKPLFMTDPVSNPSIFNSSEGPSATDENSEKKPKLVLFYTRYRGNRLWMDEHMTKDGIKYYLNTNVQTCPYKCTFTHRKELEKEANAVLFSIVDNFYFPEKPEFPTEPRNPDQIWIAYASTAAANLILPKYNKIDTIYNWTATYRLDSDIYWPYGFFYKLEGNQSSMDNVVPSSPELLQSGQRPRKELIASMIVAKCTTESFREGVISELQSYVNIDIYGACGSHKCPHTLEDKEPCREHIGKHYKFYLSFENSLCEDYITDEFFTAFQHGMVPVTYGLGDYTQVAPRHSYINMLDFPSVKHLAKYLMHLDSNDAEYKKYFEWRKEYGIQVYNVKYSVLCGLCGKLWDLDNVNNNNINVTRKELLSFQDWWNSKRNDNWGSDYFKGWFLNSHENGDACKYLK